MDRPTRQTQTRHQMNHFIHARRRQVFDSVEVGHILSGNLKFEAYYSDDDDDKGPSVEVELEDSEEDSFCSSSSAEDNEVSDPEWVESDSDTQSTCSLLSTGDSRQQPAISEPESGTRTQKSTRRTRDLHPQPAKTDSEPRSKRSRTQPSSPCRSEPPWLSDTVRDVGPPHQIRFNPKQEVGPQLLRSKTYTPVQLFQLFFSQSALRTLCENTNKCAARNKAKGKKYKWVDLDVPELKKFIGLLIYMAFVELSGVRDYWKKNHVCSVPYPRQIMARDRFRVIMWNIHMSDPAEDVENDRKKGTSGYDKLFRLKPLLGELLNACRAHYGPDKELSVDESMVPTKAKTGMTQYMKDKPNKWGMKLFVLAEARSGYTLYFNVYTGKTLTGPSAKGVPYDAVMDLITQAKLGTGHHIYMDNFYTSPRLLLDLFEQKYGACGTYKDSIKGCPQSTQNALPKNAPKGTMRWIREQDLVFVKWMDTKEVRVCSTIHPAVYDGHVQRKVRKTDMKWERINIPCPTPIKVYNKYMGGVDLADQLIQYHSTHRKVARWYRTLFLHFLDIAATNAFILHKELAKDHTDPPMDHKKFMVSIVSELCGTDMAIQRKSYQHLPVQIANVEDFSLKATKGRRACALCKARINKEWNEKVAKNKVKKNEKKPRCSDTPWMCECCEVPLCIIPGRNCFLEYHN